MTVGKRVKKPTRLLRGRIENLTCTRGFNEFVFDEIDKRRMGETALVAALADLGGMATGLYAASQDTEESAELMEFDLDGKHIKAWVWLSIFHEGDDVEVVAEPLGDGWYGYGIRRVSDSIVALHPHCSTGRYGHFKSTAKWWLVWCISILVFAVALIVVLDAFRGFYAKILPDILDLIAVSWSFAPVFALISVRLSYKYMRFVRLAEGIFDAFGWKNPKAIDLARHTRKHLQPGDEPLLGYLLFRYDEPTRSKAAELDS